MIANIIEKKLRRIGKFDGAKVRTNGVSITSWEVDGVPQPTDQELEAWKSEIEADEQTEKQGAKNTNKALMTKLGLSKQEVKALIALIREGVED